MGTSVSTNYNTVEAGVDSIPGASTPDSCKDSSSTKSKESASSKFSNNDVCVNNMLKNMSTADNEDDNSADVREESFECGLCSWGKPRKCAYHVSKSYSLLQMMIMMKRDVPIVAKKVVII